MTKMLRLFAGVARVQESSPQVLSDRDRLLHQSKNKSMCSSGLHYRMPLIKEQMP